MKKLVLLSLPILIVVGAYITFTSQQNQTPNLPQPTNGKTTLNTHQSEDGDSAEKRRGWVEMMHRAAPETNWQSIDDATRLEQYKKKKALRENPSRNAQEILANGNLIGEWFERGSNNQSGSVRKVAYDKNNDDLYAISDGGTIWKGEIDGSSWVAMNKDLRFGPKILQSTTNASGGVRLLAAIGKTVYYSDDEGATWNPSTGFNFYDDWGNNEYWSHREMVVLNDASKTVYYFTMTWDPDPWAERIWIFRSTDNGATFTKIHSTTHGEYRQVSMWSPYNSSEAYFLDQNSDLYQINGAALTLLNSNNDIPANVNLQLKGHQNGFTNTFYVLAENNKVYRSTNNGASFNLQGTTPVDAWSMGINVSLSDANALYMGAVNSYRSINGGANWTLVNEWWEYYGDVTGKLHADLMDITPFRKADNTEFTLISNHGGLSISYDKMVTNTNISLSGLNVSQYYDVITDPFDPNHLYAGAQDQGFQRSAFADNTDVVNFEQPWSGDYGHLSLANNGQSIFTVYPGGILDFYRFAQTEPYPSTSWTMIGDDRAANDWIIPTAPTTNPASQEVYMAGGNINGGPGSYLIKLTAANSSPYTITPAQYNYDFKANSNTGSGLIASIEASEIDAGRLYVGTSDGSFFYSNNDGNNWTKSSSFTGPGQHWLYGSTILASKQTPNLVYFGGSGYSNPAVYVSTNGGQNFSPMDNGLPNTLVYELAANTDESLLFAATEVGPFVYVVAEGTWYDMRGLNAPQQVYHSVEFVESSNTVRYATYGRGVWDFAIQPLLGCEVPNNVAATVISGNVLRLTWDAAASAERYRIRYRELGGTWTEKLTASTETFRFLNGLIPSTSYQYQIKTLCAASNSVWSPTYTIATSAFKCDFPESSSETNLTASTATVSWPSDPDDLKYKLKYRPDLGGNPWIELNFEGSIKNLSGLNASTLYKYKLKTKCAGGWTNWNSNAFFSTSTFVNTDVNARKTATIDVNIYPNPVTDFLTVELDSDKVEAITIHDINGQMKRRIISINDRKEIDVSELPTSTYYLTIVMKDHSLVSKSFVKN